MRKLLLIVCALFGFMACTQNPIEEQSGVRADAPETIKVGFEDDETRIQLNGAQKTVWTKNDQVSVFYRSNGNQKWEYTGETGARTAELRRVEVASGTRDMDRVVVVYPYNEDYYINPSTFNVQASLPAVQHYLADSYGTDGNIMISSSEYNQFSLKSVCGWLKIQLTGDGEKIKSITLRGNNDEQVAGELYINSEDATAVLASEMGDADDNNAGGALVFDDTILREVVLDCGEGVELIPVVTSFYIALPPQSFEQGITLEITDDSGYTMTQSTSKLVSIERNHIQPMTAFEFINPSTPATPKPANNEIWYTATEQVEPYWDDANTYGVRLVSNTWDEATGKGVYTFAGDVTKVGAEAFLECKKLQSVTLPDSATEIGSNAFKNCDGLVEVTIGDGITNIGSYAFYDCDALTTVSFGDSLQTISYYAFYSCNALSEIVIGGNITTVGSRVFYECKKLTRAVMGDSVTSVGNEAFYGCSSLKDVIIGSGITKINSEVFYNCSSLSNLILGDGLTEIGSYAFRGCSSLKSIVIPDGVTTIDTYAFQGCSNLESISFGNNIEDIDPNIFESCDAIKLFYGKYATNDGRALINDNKIILYAKASGTDYTIPNNVTTIGNRAFYRANLASVTIPESVTSIEDDAFNYCSSLKKVYLKALNPPSCGYGVFSSNASGRRFYVYDEAVNTYKKLWSGYASSIYGNGSYEGAETTIIYYTTNDGNIVNTDYLPIKDNTYIDGQGKMVVYGTLDKIPHSAFYNKVNLVSITIPDSVTYIGDEAFSASWKLESVNIPEGVTYIGCDAFYGCNISSVTIPDSVSDIGFGAFRSCYNLTSFNGKFAVDGGDALVVDNKFIAFAPASLTADYTIPENVTIIGDNAFYGCKLTSVTIHDNVTSIGDGAFSDCYDLHSIVVGKGVEKIGSWAFAYGSDQRSIYMKPTVPPTCDAEYAFEGWYEDEGDFLKIYVPIASEYVYKSSWTKWSGYIHAYDFDKVQTNYEIWYTSIDDILITPNTSYYGANVISNTYNKGFGVISFDREITTIGESMFSGEDKLLSISLPESVTSIGDNAFSSCWNLSRVNIPDSVTTIGNYAFEGCNLAYITIPDGVTEIGNMAFCDCELTSVTIPDSVVAIGKRAFSNWYLKNFKGKFASEDGRCLIVNGVLNSFAPADITSYVIPNSVTEIGDYAFYGCDNMKSITIPDSVTTIGEEAFRDCDYLTNVTIPNSVTTIGEGAFSYCRSITSVNIPASLTIIDYNPFYGCNKLEEFTGMYAADGGRCVIKDKTIIAYASASGDEYVIPEGVVKIGDYAFCGSNITKVTIPNSVTTIGDCAFFGCHSICEVYCKSTTPPIYSRQAFDATPAAKKFYVPMSSVDAYKTASGWKMYSDKIVGYDFENGVVVE